MVSRLEALGRDAQDAVSPELGEAWRAFAADLESDLIAHERQVMARAHRGRPHREHARRVTQEHAAARALVREIGRQIATRRPLAVTFDVLAEILRGRVLTAAELDGAEDPLP